MLPLLINAQGEIANKDDERIYKPLLFKLNEDGSHFMRMILWHQMWATTNNLSGDDNLQINPSIRRSRVLAYAQISDRFLILTHFGLNNFNVNNQTSLGNNGDGAQFFLHDAWGEVKVNKALYLGMGMHYWKGATRLANASTLNFMTMDQARPFTHWHNFGITDQFARHFGIYAKGEIGRFDYRIAANSPSRNPLAGGINYSTVDGANSLTYQGVNNRVDGTEDGDLTGNYIYEGYFRYSFWDKESTKLPYMVGSYLGKKKVLALGTGFFLHPNGMFNDATNEHGNVSVLAVDAFMEYPFADGNMLHTYASVMNMDYGENFVGRWGLQVPIYMPK